MILAALLALVVGTWNGNWFPSGRAEHRARPEVEAATIAEAGRILAAGIRAVDPTGKEDVVLTLSEIRNREVAEALAERIGRENLKVAAISAYRRRDRFDGQQDVILTTLPVVDSCFVVWRRAKAETPPRGFAYASVLVDPATTAAVYSVHLKSNYGATTDEIAALNRAKRTRAIDELLDNPRELDSVIVGGDFNADPWRDDFKDETIFFSFASAGFTNLMSLLAPENRATLKNRRYGDSCLDHIMVRGFESVDTPYVIDSSPVSDHAAVFARVKPSAAKRPPRRRRR